MTTSLRGLVVSFLLLIAGLLSIGGCSDDPNDLGLGILPPGDVLQITSTQLEISKDSSAFRRIPGSSNPILVGRSQSMEAVSIVEFIGIPTFSNATIDSAIITMQIGYRFLDTSGTLDLDVRRMEKSWSQSAFRWDSLTGAIGVSAGTSMHSVQPSDTMIRFPIDTALIRLWSQSGGTGSILLTPGAGSSIVLGFKNYISSTNEEFRPELRISYRQAADTTLTQSIRASRGTFVADGTIPLFTDALTIQAGIGQIGILAFDISPIPSQSAITKATLELTLDPSRSLRNAFTRDSLIVYMLRKDVAPFDSVALGTLASPIDTAGNRVYRADVSAIVQNWRIREPNRGFLVTPYAEFSSLDRFVMYGRDAQPEFRPKLTITYTTFP
jgi:hypothetical protein